MKSKTILITHFSDELFIYAFRTMLHEEHGIVAIDNLEIFLNKVTNDGMGLFSCVQTDENNEIIGLAIAQPIKLSNNHFEESYGYIKVLWVSNKCSINEYGTKLLELCEKQFSEMQITQFVADLDEVNEELFLNNHYVKNNCFSHNNNPVLCKKEY